MVVVWGRHGWDMGGHLGSYKSIGRLIMAKKWPKKRTKLPIKSRSNPVKWSNLKLKILVGLVAKGRFGQISGQMVKSEIKSGHDFKAQKPRNYAVFLVTFMGNGQMVTFFYRFDESS
jgi:hypothetical protein